MGTRQTPLDTAAMQQEDDHEQVEKDFEVARERYDCFKDDVRRHFGCLTEDEIALELAYAAAVCSDSGGECYAAPGADELLPLCDMAKLREPADYRLVFAWLLNDNAGNISQQAAPEVDVEKVELDDDERRVCAAVGVLAVSELVCRFQQLVRGLDGVTAARRIKSARDLTCRVRAFMRELAFCPTPPVAP